jgi:hypothetical protein
MGDPVKQLLGVVAAVAMLAVAVGACRASPGPTPAPTPPPFLTPEPGSSQVAPSASEARAAGILAADLAATYAAASWYGDVRQSGGIPQVEVAGSAAWVLTDLPRTEPAQAAASVACGQIAALARDSAAEPPLGIRRVVILGGQGRDEVSSCDVP